jgi:hypothetical protein
MSTFATVIGLAAAVCTTTANLPQLKKAWTTGQTDDISLKTLLLFGGPSRIRTDAIIVRLGGGAKGDGRCGRKL